MEKTVDVWCVKPQEWLDNEVFEPACQRVLSLSEWFKISNLRLENRRQQQKLTRVLVRLVLSQYSNHDPKDWVFSLKVGGKPFVANASHPLFFNVSHTQGLIVCAVSVESEVGVDVEILDKKRNFMAIAQQYFAEQEFQSLRALRNEQERKLLFFQLWTLKEAYLKACGKGITVPLSSICFDTLPINDRHKLDYSAHRESSSNHWQLKSARLSEKHLMAVALRLEPSDTFDLNIYHVSPSDFNL
ncbi:4'-phosphopantetheinyl transferase family protein [Vibrio agarivorans]|uniref:4'-phosphopantetheinyl transferase family protein n=1 Tax=Vibrio agarivorans TaxID=153622 RepID=UPI002231CE4D|nr:4'-phosphopantetheinyl transferase superfamily protein [Vibrio agarivorans]